MPEQQLEQILRQGLEARGITADEEALDAVVHAIDFFDTVILRCADGAGKARVDDRGGTAGLSNDHITHYA